MNRLLVACGLVLVLMACGAVEAKAQWGCPPGYGHGGYYPSYGYPAYGYAPYSGPSCGLYAAPNRTYTFYSGGLPYRSYRVPAYGYSVQRGYYGYPARGIHVHYGW